MSDIIYLTWDADIKPGQEEGFQTLARKWAEIAAKDPDTMYSDWSISEDGKSVRIDGRYKDAAATAKQFGTNLWGELDNHLKPTGMVVCGKLSKELEFLREHGATFMLPVED